MLNQPSGPAQLDRNGNASAFAVLGNGTMTPRTLGAWKADRINIRDFGALGDTREYNGPVTLTTTNPTTLGGLPSSTFSTADIGKTIFVWGAGAPASTGSIMSIPMAAQGAGYTSVPTVAISAASGAGTKAVAIMGVTGLAVTSAGSGYPASSTQLFTAYLQSGGAGGVQVRTNMTVALATTAAGAIDTTVAPSFSATGATPGEYFSLPASMTGITLVPRTAPTGAYTQPAATLSFGVVEVFVTQGSGYPLTGVTAALSGGTPASPTACTAMSPAPTPAGCVVTATLGTPVVTAPVQPLVTTIAGVPSSTSVTLAQAATTDPSTQPAPLVSAYTVRWGTDDSAALAAAVAAADTRMQMQQIPCVYAPAGNYLIRTAPGQFAEGHPGCVLGDGSYATSFYTTPDFSGDLFAWQDAWPWATSIHTAGGGHAEGFSVMGAGPESPYQGPLVAFPQQNGLMLYGHDDYFLARDVAIHNLAGIGIGIGKANANTPVGTMREGYMDGIRIFSSGRPGIAALDIDANGPNGTDATNTDHFGVVNIYGSNGPALWVHSHSGSAMRGITFTVVRLEGVQAPTGVAYPGPSGDLLEIGDPGAGGTQVKGISFLRTEIASSPIGFAAVHVTCNGPSTIPNGIVIHGGDIVGTGPALALDCGAEGNVFHLADVTSSALGVSVGAAPLVTGPQMFDNTNLGDTLASSVATPSNLLSPVWQQSALGQAGFGLTLHNGSPAGGAALGMNAVDLQIARSSPAYAATGNGSVVGGGGNNTASNSAGTVSGGSGNANAGFGGMIGGGISNAITGGTAGTISGGISNKLNSTYSAIPGGADGTDRTDTALAFAAGDFSAVGDAQHRWVILRGATAGGTAMRLTTNGNTAAAANNGFTAALNSAYNLAVHVVVRDVTTPANTYVWTVPVADFTIQDAGSTMQLAAATPATQATGTGSGVTVTMATDQTLHQLVITVTPPAGSDTWHAVAWVSSTEG